MKRRTNGWPRAWLLVSLMGGSASGEVTFRVTDLGSVASTGGFSEAFAVNEQGQVTGFSSTDLPGVNHAFVWLPAPALGFATRGMKDLDPAGGALKSAGHDINLEGRIAGVRDTAQPAIKHAILWQPGLGILDLGSLNGPDGRSEGWGISDGPDYVVVGETETSAPCDPIGIISLGFRWEGLMLPLLPDGEYFVDNNASAAYAVNYPGDFIGGDSSLCFGGPGFCGGGSSDAVYWHPDGVALNQPVGFGDGSGAVLGVNTSGQLAGWGKEDGTPTCPGSRALLWTDPATVVNLHAGPQVVNPLPAGDETQAEAVNDSTNVVGQNETHQDAILWEFFAGNWTYVNLQDRIHGACDWDLREARDINNAQWIVGWGINVNGMRAFLLTPLGSCPEDINGDGMVSTADFLEVLTQWGACQVGVICTADVNGDCMVSTADFNAVLAAWGPCPAGAAAPGGTGPEAATAGWDLTPQQALLLMGFDSIEAYEAWLSTASQEQVLASIQCLLALLQ